MPEALAHIAFGAACLAGLLLLRTRLRSRRSLAKAKRRDDRTHVGPAAAASPRTEHLWRENPNGVVRKTVEEILDVGRRNGVDVDDELFVGKVTPEARAYADFQGLVIHEVGDLAAWLEKPATKVVSVGEPELLDGLEARLKQPDTRRGWLMDGFPRTLPQAEGLREMTERIGQRVDAAVILGVSNEVIVKRLIGRNREDDAPGVVRKRIEVFESQTRPVFDFFRQHFEVVEIDAARSIDEVTEALRVGLDRFDHP